MASASSPSQASRILVEGVDVNLPLSALPPAPLADDLNTLSAHLLSDRATRDKLYAMSLIRRYVEFALQHGNALTVNRELDSIAQIFPKYVSIVDATRRIYRLPPYDVVSGSQAPPACSLDPHCRCAACVKRRASPKPNHVGSHHTTVTMTPPRLSSLAPLVIPNDPLPPLAIPDDPPPPYSLL